MISTTKKQLGFTTLSHQLNKATSMAIRAKETLNLGYETREMIRFNEQTWVIYEKNQHQIATVDENTLTSLICGTLTLTDLNWR
jgi:hypothetical protein